MASAGLIWPAVPPAAIKTRIMGMVATILTSPSANARTKDKARELKDQILEDAALFQGLGADGSQVHQGAVCLFYTSFTEKRGTIMRALIAVSGTGGHINPPLAIARALKAADPAAQIHFALRK